MILSTNPHDFAVAVRLLRGGAVAVFPTDTVYGLGVAVSEKTSPDAVFVLKNRDRGKTLPLLIGAGEQLQELGREVPEYAFALADQHWPGALTLVVKASSAVPRQFQSDAGTIAVRYPAHPATLALLEALGTPLAATSANRSGMPPALSVRALDPALVNGVVLVIDGGISPGGIPSTIVSCTGHEPVLLREGAIPWH
ncbi:MAG: threonylcarbamoyl-AMP synthase [Coriobacteriales bacterium]|nr:threonylcarbamoyl-AMP synthase [Coriobacteriales bacterium]